MEYKPKVLIIHSSPRRYGASSQLAEIAGIGVNDAGGLVERIFLYDYNIKPCIGCVSDGIAYCRFPCIIRDDDFNYVANKIMEADGLIIATPVYWYAPSGILKNVLDRLTSMENMIFHKSKSLLEGKVAGFIATGLDSGVMTSIAYLMAVLNSMGVIIPPWSMAYSHVEEIVKDENALRDAYNVGYLVTEALKALKAYDKPLGYKPDIEVKKLTETLKNYSVTKSSEREIRLKLLNSLLDQNR
ncbi:MAG: flavodoxin family protein [Desulfurococcaceae archaeon]